MDAINPRGNTVKIIDEMARHEGVITAGTVPIHPSIVSGSGKVLLFVQDGEDGRSLFIGVETFGEKAALFEVEYDQFVQVYSQMVSDVIIEDAGDPFAALLQQEVSK